MRELRGRVAVVTGAGSGIGRAIAHSLAEAGVSVVVSDIREDAAREVANQVQSKGGDAMAIVADTASRPSVVHLADEAYSRFQRVDILCNNAGVSWRPLRTVLEASIDDWAFIVNVNFWGVVHGLDVFLPRMRKQPGEKHIVNTASLGAVVPLAGHAPYSATKAAVASVSECIAQELKSEGFGVTVLCPGVVRTNIVSNSEALRPEGERAMNREIKAYENTLQSQLATQAIDPESVGHMVRSAILANQLYLHTQPVDQHLIQQRMMTIFGPDTAGRVS